MQKVIYLLWRDSRANAEDFFREVRTELADRLVRLGARHLQLNLDDADVRPADGLRQEQAGELPQAVVSFWLDSAVGEFRRPYDEVLQAACARIAGYLVCESVPIPNTRFPARAGQRTHGFSQLALLQRPARLTHEAWLAIWQNHHTRVAIDTQDNFQYVQNLVVQVLTPGAAPLAAIVEECFPPAAMTDPMAFFDAPGDEAKFQDNLAVMMDSCQRFIDFDQLGVVLTSQYPQ
ncbi:EthD domain-containing protein [Pseudomonas sp. SCB32]|uniref:EthD domain-containing protein n=1 Tax=Pseudomonas sp. SCB32 TaxID=2653853 RepID=UPI001264D5CD|nr:EthD domain-containing protein [Pseudomonas sp. SCB32]